MWMSWLLRTPELACNSMFEATKSSSIAKIVDPSESSEALKRDSSAKSKKSSRLESKSGIAKTVNPLEQSEALKRDSSTKSRKDNRLELVKSGIH